MMRQGTNIEGIIELSDLRTLQLQESTMDQLQGDYQVVEGIEAILNVILTTSIEEIKQVKGANRCILIGTYKTDIHLLILQKDGMVKQVMEQKHKAFSTIVPPLAYTITPYIVEAAVQKETDTTLSYTIHHLLHIEAVDPYRPSTTVEEMKQHNHLKDIDLTSMFL